MDLSEIRIEKLKKEELNSAYSVIKESILGNIQEEKLAFPIDYILRKQKERLENIFEKPELGQFLVARNNTQVVGTIGFTYKIGKTIEEGLKLTKTSSSGMVEIIAAFIRPSFQAKGIGSLLFKSIIEILKEKEIQYFSLQAGYKKGIKFWQKKLGKQTTILKNYYNGQDDCYIWIREINKSQIT